jgi:catechol 2,3-dioxygenase-like lactoylglutathione lyase family enzyme
VAIAPQTQQFNVGGVLLDRPFKVRRLGHFGFNLVNVEEGRRFYTELLGFRISDFNDPSARAQSPEQLTGMGDPRGFFLHHGGDHHSFVMFNKRVREALDTRRRFAPGVTINQITWQVGSLQEVGQAIPWLKERGMTIQRAGRDMPGSNWHTYFYDPDGHTNELYYGIEQIGWNGESRPDRMYTHERHFRYAPDLPQIPDAEETLRLLDQGIDVHGGPSDLERAGEYEVEGVMLQRPFRVVRVGPVRLFVKHLDVAERFYRDTLGFALTEEIRYHDHRCVFLRANTEHHSLALYPLDLRAELGFRLDSSCMSLGVQVATYRQLKDAVAFLRNHGCAVRELPPELFPGLGHSAFVLDPDGNAIQLYSYMEQIGWDGRPRPANERPAIKQGEWPETVPGQTDAYEGEVFLGPLG